jgi:GR25 family glycosyltransferase involved in LPS biosynthesis
MEQVDVIFYINLESRIDRKEHFLSEIKKLCIDESKIVRVDAIKEKYGALGCTKSHIKALELFMENPLWTTCMVFEDDYTFYNTDIIHNNNLLKSFFQNFTDWGMLLLSSNQAGRPSIKTHIDSVELVTYSQTTSGYCIHKDSVKELYDNFKESAELLEKSKSKPKHAVDMYWNKVTMKRYSFVPNMGHQYVSYSDIENRVVHYNC